MKINFYKDKVCLNVLTKSLINAKEINEIMEGHVVLGLLTANYNSLQEAIEDILKYKEVTNNNISIGLGQGNPANWKKVAIVSKIVQPKHINQVFSAVGYTRAYIENDASFINALVSLTGKVGYLKINTGELSSFSKNDAIVPVETVIDMVKEMGGNSLKFFPMKGLSCKDELEYVAKACAENNFALEPTGGIDLNNFEEILTIINNAGVKKIIPHVYSSIVDKETKLTKIEDVKKLYEMIKKVVG